MKAYDEMMLITYVTLSIIEGHIIRNHSPQEFEVESYRITIKNKNS
jgi:hypothetical protein